MRSEEEVLSGQISVVIGGERRSLPTLKIRAAREWKTKLGERLPALFKVDRDSIVDLFGIASDSLFDILVEYDTSNALGGRDWLEEHLDDGEVYHIVRQIIDVHFPFLKDVPTALQAVRQVNAQAAMLALQQPPAPSTNGPSPNGTSETPAPSKSGSTKRS
jgi:hypothetical protein